MTPSEVLNAILALVFLPASILIVVAYFLRKLFERLLNKDIEGFKARLQTEIETYKAGLKAEYDLKHTEFQTRFSLLHQRRADAIEKLFSLLSKIQNDLQCLTNWDKAGRTETREEFYAKTLTDLENLADFFDEKRIYFDDEIRDGTLRIVSVTSFLKDGIGNPHPALAKQLEEQGGKIVDDEIHPVMTKLERKIREILSAERPA